MLDIMIAFQNVSKLYSGSGGNTNQSSALMEVNFQIQPNEFVSLVGRSGAGKSTILNLITGELKPSKGRVIFGSYEVNKLSSQELPHLRRHIGVIFQDFRLLPNRNSYENVAFALEACGYSQGDIDELVPQALEMVGLKDKAFNFPHELSGGEKQRVAIARAMIHRPEVIMADEPTGNLDPFNKWEIIKLLGKINELGTTVILATHDKDIVNSLGRRVITLDGGRIVLDEEKGKFILV